MNDHEPLAAPGVKVAQHLTAIVNMAADLHVQAIHSANARDMPGGDALVALAPVADPTEYAENIEAAEHKHEANPLRWGEDTLDLEHEDDDLAPLLQTLRHWSDRWRTIHDQELNGRRATIASEANFLRWALGWAWDNEEQWDNFATDIRNARRNLENVLRAGERVERTRVECDRETCELRPRLILIRTDDPTGAGDFHKCPSCRAHFDADDFTRARATMMRRESAAKFVPLRDAVAVLHNLGRSDRTVRSWLTGDEPVEVYCDTTTRRSYVWWPDLWRKHLTTKQRNRSANV